MFGTPSAVQQIELQVEQNGNFQDKLFLRLDANSAASGKESTDLLKFYNDNVNMYTINRDDNTRMAIDARNVLTTFPLGISAAAGNYNFKVAANTLTSTTLYLIDKQLNTQTELKAGNTYSFSITSDTASQGEYRFVISNQSITTLPVQLVDITAQLQTNNTVAVNWVSATELNLANYQVQRSSDGTNFSMVGTLAAKGASAYTYIDDISSIIAQLSTVYYRLEAVDNNGSKSYSKVVAVGLGNSQAKASITIYPNPVKATLYAQVTATKASNALMNVIDAQGKIVATQKTQLAAGTTSVAIPLAQLTAGSYTLEIVTADGKQQQRFVK